MDIDKTNWAEQGLYNMTTGFVMGTMYGGSKYYWSLAPSAQGTNADGRHQFFNPL